MLDKFTIEEKRKLLQSVLTEIGKVKERFQDLTLGSEVIRFPLTVGKEYEYAGRDLILVYDFMKEPEKLKTTDLKVSFASPYYKMVRNESLSKAIENELLDASIEFRKREKKESISDYSALYALPENKGILVRNSYVPSRAIKVVLSIKKSIYIPALELKIIHTDKEIRKYELRLKEKLEKLSVMSDIVDELERVSYTELPEALLMEIAGTSYSKYITKKGFTEEQKILLGKDILEEAKKENWSALKLMEEFLKKCYITNRYTLKRKADNIILNHFEMLLKSVFSH